MKDSHGQTVPCRNIRICTHVAHENVDGKWYPIVHPDSHGQTAQDAGPESGFSHVDSPQLSDIKGESFRDLYTQDGDGFWVRNEKPTTIVQDSQGQTVQPHNFLPERKDCRCSCHHPPEGSVQHITACCKGGPYMFSPPTVVQDYREYTAEEILHGIVKFTEQAGWGDPANLGHWLGAAQRWALKERV